MQALQRGDNRQINTRIHLVANIQRGTSKTWKELQQTSTATHRLMGLKGIGIRGGLRKFLEEEAEAPDPRDSLERSLTFLVRPDRGLGRPSLA
ncbi:hypothetical protein EYF80_036645 [Liparis tanakae]|uniref:Uncharacterized protein n=1 Tax=Liparis tanakae TaxID=230148 RepID=A0A4Z2GI46_9TELE|nr:hypothetical protein EYF80_036645 [Liparis tanakae]